MFTVTLTSYGQTQISDLVQIDGIILLYEYVSDISSISNISSYTQVLDEDSAGNIKNNICNVLISDSSSSEYQAHTILFYKNNSGTKNILGGYSAEEPFIKKSASAVNLWFSFDFSAFTNGFALSAIKAGFANASHNEDGLLHLENPNITSDDNYSVYNKSQVDALLQDKQSTLSAGDGIAISNGTVKTTGIPFGIVDNTSTATVFTVTVPGIYKLEDGVCCLLKNGVITSATGFTLEVNGLGAKPVYSNMAAATRETTIFNVNYTMLFVYDSTRIEGGAWICYRGYFSDANSIAYQIRGNVHTLPTTAKFYRYRLLFTSADGTHFVPSNTSTSTNATAKRDVVQTPIDPFGEIVYYSTTTAVEANANPGPAYLWTQYAITFGYSFNRTGATLTLTSFSPVYIKCAPQSNGSAIIDADTPYVQALPNTADGKIYIFLGVANSAIAVELLNNHPIYYHDGTGIRIWHGKDSYSKSELDTIIADYVQTSRTINNKPLTSDITLTLDDISDGTNRSIPTVNNSTITIKKNSSDTGDSFTTNAASGKTINLGLATVATSGSYNDLSDKPTIPTVNDTTITIKKNSSDTGDNFTTNASSAKTINLGLSTVATSGSYNDLSNKPTIPTVNNAILTIQKNSDDDGDTFTANASTDKTINLDLADVASSGSYNDLSDKPTIPTVNNSTITIKKNTNDTGDSFTTNAASGKTINLGLSTVATSGSYNDLSNKPTIPTVNNAKLTIKKNSSDTGTEFTANASSDVTCNLNLATIATSGSYNDLSNKPTIPTVNNATLTIQKNGTTVNTFTANASSNVTANITVPTTVAELTDAGNYAQSSSLTSLVATAQYNSTDKTIEFYNASGTKLNTDIDATAFIKDGMVDNVEITGGNLVISFNTDAGKEDIEIPISDIFDASNYYTKSQVDGLIPTVNNAKLTIKKNASDTGTEFTANASSNVTCNLGLATVATSGSYNDLSNKPTIPTVNNAKLTIKKSSTDAGTEFTANASTDVTCNLGLSAVATSGSYNDLSNKPTIPADTGDLTNNAGFITSSDLPTNHVTTDTVQEITGAKTIAEDKLKIGDTTTNEDIDNFVFKRGQEFIVGTQSSATSLWQGVTLQSAIYEGMCINYLVPVACTSTAATLELTLPDNTTTGAIPVRRNAANTVTSTHIGVGSVVQLTLLLNRTVGSTTYEKVWKMNESYDSNTNTIAYQLRGNSALLPASDTSRYYKLFFSSADNTKWVPASINSSNNTTTARTANQRPINPFGRIAYTSATTSYTAGTNVAATTLWDQYTVNLGYSFGTLSLTPKLPVYIKCAPQSDGSAIIDSTTPVVQSLPSSADNKIYIFLGTAYGSESTTQTIEMFANKPVYYHDGTGIRLWTGIQTPDLSGYVPTSRKVNNKALSSDITLTLDDVADGTNRSIPTVNNSTITIKKNSDDTGDSFTTNASSGKTINLGLSTVATSGSYNDLSNKPTIPTVNNATLTIQKNGTSVGTFTANASSNATANITVPLESISVDGTTQTITNRNVDLHIPADITNSELIGGFVRYNVSGSGNLTISNTYGLFPYSGGSTTTLPAGTYLVRVRVRSTTASYSITVNFGPAYTISTTNGIIDDLRSVTLSSAQGFSASITTVAANTYLRVVLYEPGNAVTAIGPAAVTNDYNDLNNIPNGTLIIQKNGSNVASFSASADSNVTANITVPTNTNQLTNGAGFITSSDLPTNHVTTDTTQAITGEKTFVTKSGGGLGNDIKIAYASNATDYVAVSGSVYSSTSYRTPYIRHNFIYNNGDLSSYIETSAKYAYDSTADEYALTEITSIPSDPGIWSLGTLTNYLKSIYAGSLCTREIGGFGTTLVSFNYSSTTFNKNKQLNLAKDTNTFIYINETFSSDDYRYWELVTDQNDEVTGLSLFLTEDGTISIYVPLEDLDSINPIGELNTANMSITTTSVTDSLKDIIDAGYSADTWSDKEFAKLRLTYIDNILYSTLTGICIKCTYNNKSLLYVIPITENDSIKIESITSNPGQGDQAISYNSFTNTYAFTSDYDILLADSSDQSSIKDYVDGRVNSIVSNGVGYASSAGSASKVYVSRSSSNYSYPLVFTEYATAGGTLSANNKSLYTDTVNSVYYNPSTNTLTCPNFAGNATSATNLKYSSTNVLSATSTTQVTSYGNIVPDNAGTLRYIGTLNNKWGGVYTSQITFDGYTDSNNNGITPCFLVDSTNSEASYRGIKVVGNIKPSVNNQFSLGNQEHRWKNIYANGINSYYIEIGNCTSVDDNNNIETQEPVIRPSTSGWGYLGTPKKHFYRAYIDDLYIGTSNTTLSSYIASTTVTNATYASNIGTNSTNSVATYTYSSATSRALIPTVNYSSSAYVNLGNTTTKWGYIYGTYLGDASNYFTSACITTTYGTNLGSSTNYFTSAYITVINGTTFTGTASKATADASGNTITSSYASSLRTNTRATASTYSTFVGSTDNRYIALYSKSADSLGRVYLSDIIANAVGGYGGVGWGTAAASSSSAGYITTSSFGSVGTVGLFICVHNLSTWKEAGDTISGTCLYKVRASCYSSTSTFKSTLSSGVTAFQINADGVYIYSNVLNSGTAESSSTVSVGVGSQMSGTWRLLSNAGYSNKYLAIVAAVRIL